MKPGDAVEFKAGPGLGGWQRGRLVSNDGRHCVVEGPRAGQAYSVPCSRVRVRDEAPSVQPVRAQVVQPVAVAPAERQARARAAVAPLLAQPKPRAPARSQAFLAFVRGKPCCACSAPAPSDPHHYGRRGIGQKTDDFRTVPLCRRCHDRWHAEHVVEGDADRRETDLRFLRVQVGLLVEWIRRCDDGEDGSE